MRAGSASDLLDAVAIRQFDAGPYHWRVAPASGFDASAGGIDWFRLKESPCVVLVKRNSQRDVWRVGLNGRDYFAKLYHPNGALAGLKLLFRGHTALREWDVGRYACGRGINTVIPVATAWGNGRYARGSSLLITEAIPDVQPLSDYWLSIRDDRWQANLLSDCLARLIARAHQCGLRHGDMHPGNILVRRMGHRCEVYFVDLHKVRIGRPVTMRQVAANLAQLNQWFRRHASAAQRRRFLRRYIEYRDQFAQASPFARNWRIDLATLAADLAVQAERHANRLWAKRDRRTRRDGRYFARIRPAPGWRGYALLQTKHPGAAADAARLTYTRRQWEEWLADPLSWVDPARHELLKDSHTSTVCRVALPTTPKPTGAIVKRTLPRNPWKRLGQMLGPSRNMRSWKTAYMLLNRDLPVAQPLALVERRIGLCRTESLLFTSFLPDSVDMETFLTRDVAGLPQAEQRRVKDAVIAAVSRLLKAFHERGFVHRDLKAPNLLVTWPRPYLGSPALTFVDMDGIAHRRRCSPADRMRTVVRLCASLLASPSCTCSDRLRFLKRYLSELGRPPADWKQHWRRIHEQVCSKLEHKEARRRWKLAHYGRE